MNQRQSRRAAPTAPLARRAERKREESTKVAPEESAKAAGLRYVSHAGPGFGRRRVGKSFKYVDVQGKPLRDRAAIDRIEKLVLPPAWEDVWISPHANGHLQAVGRDGRGRKQYRYHEKWREVRDENKYGRMIDFVAVLPKVRARVSRDLRRRGLPREKVLAAVVRLLETTFIRVGNDEYKKQNDSYGLTTLHNEHAKVKGQKISFTFRGKSGVRHAISLREPRLAKIIRACQDVPGEELFGYEDDKGRPHDIGSGDVNAYLREITGRDFTAKDFRTWAGTVLAARALREMEAVDSEAKRKKNIIAAIDAVAGKLGNTRSVCRKCYVHPAVMDSYLDGTLVEQAAARAGRMIKSIADLTPEEAAVLVLLQRRLEGEKKSRKTPRAA